MSIFREEEGKLLIQDSYVTVIKNSVGTNMFRNFYSEIDGTKTDVLRDGDLSCAFYVSSILMLFELIKEVHSEVDATVEDLEQSGWTRVNEPGPGDVLVWESQKGESGEFHRHIGFYIGEKRAICNDPEERKPIETHWTFNGTRAIEAIYSKKL